MREFRVGLRSYIDLRARARCQLFVPGNKVGVQMSFEDVSDSKILLFGRLQIDVHIALRINYRRLALRSDHVRSMGQTGQVELFKIHIATPGQVQFPAIVRLSHAKVQLQTQIWHSAVFARSAPNHAKTILTILAPESPGKTSRAQVLLTLRTHLVTLPKQASQPVDGLMVKGGTVCVLLL